MGYMLTALFPCGARRFCYLWASTVCGAMPTERPRVPFSGAVARARHISCTLALCARVVALCVLSGRLPPRSVSCCSAGGCMRVPPAMPEVV